MDSGRTVRLLAVLLVLVTAPAEAADALKNGDTHLLVPKHRRGELSRVAIALEVGGDLKLLDEKGQTKSLPMSVVANLGYDETLLAVEPDGRPTRSARFYDDVRAVIKIGQGGEKPSLPPNRRLVVAERVDRAPCQVYCPSEPLKREELDLVDIPGGTLVIDDLLPTEPVAVGQSWKVTDTTLAALLCLDAVKWCEVQGVLGEIKDGLAEIAAAGTVQGAAGGISTEIELKVKIKFDVQAGRIRQFAMLVKENRAIGHVGPGLDTVAKVIVGITPLDRSQLLSVAALQQIPPETAPHMLDLGYAPPGGQFQFQHDRRWYVTQDEPKLAVLRMLDRGELVAQCNVSALPAVKKPITLAEYQRDVERSLGKNFGQFAGAGQSINDAGYAVFRVEVTGEVNGLAIQWIYYLVQDRSGRRVSLAFTLEQGLTDRFAATDRAIIGAIRLTDPPAPTAAKPVTTK